MSNIDMIDLAIVRINSLILQGVANWRSASEATEILVSLKKALQEEEKARQKAYDDSIAEARERREKMKAEAAERGEEILGGETINIDLTTGKQETIIE